MPDKSTKRSALAVTGMTSFFVPFMLSGMDIALPDIQKAFSINAILLSWVITSYILTTSVLMVPAGKIADIFGRRRIYIYGITVFTISNFLCILAGSIKTFIVFRILQGSGGAMISTTGIAILTSVFPEKERGKVIGINVAATYIGISAGPFVGGLLTYYFSWKAIFLVGILMGVICILLTIMFLKGEWADARGEKFDIIGSIIYGISLVLLIYGISILPQNKAFLFILPGIAGFFIFYIHEKKIKFPVFEVRLFKKNKVFIFSSLATLINYSATFAVAFLLSLFLQYIMGLTPQSAGLVIAAQAVIQVLFSPFAGKLSDRIEPVIISSIGMGFAAIGLFLLIFLTPESPLIFIVGILCVLGFGFALFASPNTNAIMSSVEKKYYGIASGSVATMRTIGMTFSMAITTIVFAVFIGNDKITPATYPEFIKSFKISFVIFTALCVIGIYFSSVRGNLDRGDK